MKSFIKFYFMPLFFLMAITTQGFSQTKKTTSKSKSSKTTVIVKNNVRKVPSSKVTYKRESRKVVSVRQIPNKTVLKHNGENYYYSNNKFYTQSRGRYVPIAPKVGFRIKVLPPSYKRIQYDTHNYFNANGVFYIEINNQYEVVDPEVGTIVYDLPDGYEKVVVDGLSYYEYANVLYEKVQVNDTRAYEVVGIIEID
ncbi:DUF6515 family protein [uncultured Formosa sp.]|uniref:DUF6515 family protein n=1 Tax=uncultured Formosa sp. TaxID=255435 RepID=UPI002637E33E|nr:DUF6515 family protein [uncultured Formosa sp.]